MRGYADVQLSHFHFTVLKHLFEHGVLLGGVYQHPLQANFELLYVVHDTSIPGRPPISLMGSWRGRQEWNEPLITLIRLNEVVKHGAKGEKSSTN